MKITIEITLGDHVETFDDVITALQYTAGSLSDAEAVLSVGEDGYVFDNHACEVGRFRVVKS